MTATAPEPRRDNPPTPPLKRHETLQPLSREHMGGLIQARELRRAADGDQAARRAAVDAFMHVWRQEITEHFDDEERLLLPLTSSDELRARLLDEHRALRQLAARCESDPHAAASDAQLLRGLGTLLHDHIRWEERVYFEAIQREHPEALSAMAANAAEMERRRPGSRARCRMDDPVSSPGDPTRDEPTGEPTGDES